MMGQAWHKGICPLCWHTAKCDGSYFSHQNSGTFHRLAYVENINSSKCCRTVIFEIVWKYYFVLNS